MLVLCLHISCVSDSTDRQTVDGDSWTDKITSETRDSVLISGDSKAYNKIAANYILNDDAESLFYYAFVMAQKNNNGEAYFHMYFTIDDQMRRTPNLINQSSPLRNFAIYCLLKSFELHFERAKSIVIDHFPQEIPSSSVYLEKFCKGEGI